DFAPAVYNVIFSLARALGFRLDSPHNGTQPKYLADSLPEVVSVESEDGNPSTLMGECARITRAIETGCRYVPDTNQFFIREFNMPQVEFTNEELIGIRNVAAASLDGSCDAGALTHERRWISILRLDTHHFRQ